MRPCRNGRYVLKVTENCYILMLRVFNTLNSGKERFEIGVHVLPANEGGFLKEILYLHHVAKCSYE